MDETTFIDQPAAAKQSPTTSRNWSVHAVLRQEAMMITLPETNIAPDKMVSRSKLVFQPDLATVEIKDLG